MTDGRQNSAEAATRSNGRLIISAVGALGFSSVITQLALMREMLGAFSGNEMVLGIILGNWLLLTGLGAALGRMVETKRLAGRSEYDSRPRSELVLPRVLAAGLMVIAVMPLAQVWLLRTLRDVVFVRGSLVGVTGTVAASFVLLLPYCIVSGFLLTLACAIGARWTGVSPVDARASMAAGAAPARQTEGASAIGRVYVADSVGSVLGGALFSFVLVRWLDHFAMLVLPAMLSLGMAAMLAGYTTVAAPFTGASSDAAPSDAQAKACGYEARRGWVLVSIASALAVTVILLTLLVDVDAISTARQYPGQRILFRKNSPYGKLIVTESAGQFNFIENGLPILSTHNVEQIEETVHYAMAQRPDARQVLLVSGGVSGTAKEILKYGVGEVTYVELDPLILEAGREYLPDSLADPRITVVNTDGGLFVKQAGQAVGQAFRLSTFTEPPVERRDAHPTVHPTDKRDACPTYGVVIVDVPAPSTSQINRFYTAEFYREVKRILRPAGVLAFPLGRYENYVSPQLARMLASAHATLKQSFRNVLVIPGGRVFFLASDGALFPDVAARIEQRGVPTQLVNQHYLDAMLTPDRLADIQRAIAQPAVVNKDFSPVLYYYHLMHWMSQFKVRFGVLEVALLAALALYLVTIRAVPLAIFVSGFAASTLEVVLLLGFQILYGSVYGQLGIIVTMFMAGLAVGAWAGNRRILIHRRTNATSGDVAYNDAVVGRVPSRGAADLASLAFAIAGLSVLLPLVLMALGRLSGSTAALMTVRAAIALLTFVLALLVGMEFPVASRVEFGRAPGTASRLYTADFVGASLGALLASTVLIPVIGVTAVCLLTAGLNVLGGVVVLFRRT
jgi:spermidine synthase